MSQAVDRSAVISSTTFKTRGDMSGASTVEKIAMEGVGGKMPAKDLIDEAPEASDGMHQIGPARVGQNSW